MANPRKRERRAAESPGDSAARLSRSRSSLLSLAPGTQLSRTTSVGLTQAFPQFTVPACGVVSDLQTTIQLTHIGGSSP